MDGRGQLATLGQPSHPAGQSQVLTSKLSVVDEEEIHSVLVDGHHCVVEHSHQLRKGQRRGSEVLLSHPSLVPKHRIFRHRHRSERIKVPVELHNDHPEVIIFVGVERTNESED